MSGSQKPNPPTGAPNRLPTLAPAPPNPSATTMHTSSSSTPARPAQPTLLPASKAPSSNFSEFSATTAEILNRIRAGNTGPTLGTPAFEAKRAEVLQSYVTSDKLPTPAPTMSTSRRGRGGRVGTPSQLRTELAASSSTGASPASARGSGKTRGRPRGRGRGRGRGGKRKRSESSAEESEDDDDSDVSASYTPLPTKTKSGRNVNKPVVFVPTIPEPAQGTKRRKSAKSLLASQCTVCQRGVDTYKNRIVFCDVCSTAYHQYCHDPPIENEVANVLEKEWLCGPCQRSKQASPQRPEELVAGAGLTMDDRQAYFATLPRSQLISLLLHTTSLHPDIPLFPPNIHTLVAQLPRSTSQNRNDYTPQPQSNAQAPFPPPLSNAAPRAQPPSAPSAHTTTNGHPTPKATRAHTHPLSNPSDVDPAEAQLLGEISFSSTTPHPQQPPTYNASSSASIVISSHTPAALEPLKPPLPDDAFDDGYDTDPPAHYPKPGNGLARTLRPETEDMAWLVDDNYEVFSHHWRGDGSGVGPDAPAGAMAGS
ncbi:hypothetical protein M011DRAFT_479217 [Sporormia fimetaria CBS 119925]|uniref:PHD-type domain-containing protein n=1 Tax=Sporormia fimetaria CBS 119925 TaxID=1340428 RepID=A0A6A6V6Y1_9PLEO|nr:hypothetical protein M011DRAFT_479217 [Sporormia fimetaria CBS 119925]